MFPDGVEAGVRGARTLPHTCFTISTTTHYGAIVDGRKLLACRVCGVLSKYIIWVSIFEFCFWQSPVAGGKEIKYTVEAVAGQKVRQPSTRRRVWGAGVGVWGSGGSGWKRTLLGETETHPPHPPLPPA